jgi:hypothetical protein
MECNDCHNTNTWTPSDFRHMGLAFEPLDHNGNLACTDCHQTNTELVAWPFPAFQPDCAGCHAGDYELKKHESGNGGFETVSQNSDCAGACHQKNSHHQISKGGW